MSIKTKLILIVLTVFLTTGSIVGGFIYWQNSKILTSHIHDDISNTIDQTVQLIQFYFDRADNTLDNLANDPLVIEVLETKDANKLRLVSEKLTIIKLNSSIFESIALMEVNGSSCIARATNQEASSVLGRDFSERDHCKGVIKTKETYLSSAYMTATNNVPALGLVVPVKDNNGKMLGYVYGSINLKELRGYLWNLQQGKDSKVELLDRYGVMFLNTEEKIEVLDALSDEENMEINEITSSIAKGEKKGYLKDGENFIGYRFEDSFTIIYEKSEASLLVLTQFLNLTIFSALLFGMILTILVIFLFIVRITNRISRLSKITQDITSGNFNIKLSDKDIKAKDEIAILAKNFNEMAVKLKDLYDNLDKKVKDKTKKIEQSEIKLKKSLEESERLNKLMVGRELKMIELKNQLKNKVKNNN